MTYVTKGRPVTPHEREVLENLIEEASEVIQIACKVLRFGVGDIHPRTGDVNTKHLAMEIGNFQAVVEMLHLTTMIHIRDVDQGVADKHRRFEIYRQQER